jgi:uncharacterized protein (TIGR03067 family)
MMRETLTLILAGSLLAAGAAGGEAARKEQAKLQGTWGVVAAEREVKPRDRLTGGKRSVTGNSFTIQTASGATLKGDLLLDPAREPRPMDLTHTEGALRDKTWQAVYKVEGDRLTLCYAEADSGKGRPTAFTTAAGSGRLLTVLERRKPGRADRWRWSDPTPASRPPLPRGLLTFFLAPCRCRIGGLFLLWPARCRAAN